jgi:hypothetical protein
VKRSQELLLEALEREGEAQRLLLDGNRGEANAAFAEVAGLYRRSWEEAHATAFGRLAGMVKAAVLAGGGEEEAAYARAEIGEPATPVAAYAAGLAALVAGDDDAARQVAALTREGDEAFGRAAEAIAALAAGERHAYADALTGIVRDFESRESHVTGVAIADTALVLECLAERRGLAARPSSPLLPQP